MYNHTIRELVNQDYSNDKERALCEFILQMQDELNSVKNSISQIREAEPNYSPIELIIDDMPMELLDQVAYMLSLFDYSV